MNNLNTYRSPNSKIKIPRHPFKTDQNWFTQRTKNLNTIAAPYPTFTQKQKEFNIPHPQREYRRFIENRIANTGIDPHGKIQEFINKDIIHPMYRTSLYEKFDFKNPNFQHNDLINTKPNSALKWAINTMCRAPTYENLPKFQKFTEYYFPPKYNNKSPEEYRAFSLKTDHIGIKVPKFKKINKNNETFMKLKHDYCVSTETKNENKWAPFPSKDSINNLSSKEYDIINFLPARSNESNCQIMNKTLNDRKKGVGEYSDLTKTFRVNLNKDFENKLKENPKRFYKYTGIFSNMYDASHKNGDIIKPFGNKNSNK